ncbi:zinc finger BED domain-containing protein 4-like [Aplysia californica]|uniref:Zinc finger BED domain-containing protein 4-like n=1 Tax=Aplysia californica TaxID=6500 RepID=A0ABM1A8M5_APLCA|nr:zinc finger BED domain-containing protein 4-like [Aplysia californica]
MRQTKGDLAAQLRSGILSRFAGAEERFLWAAATFIDPRFKKHGFRNPDNAQVIKDRLMSRMRPAAVVEEEPEQETGEGAQGSSSAFDRLWTHFDSKIKDVKKSTTSALMDPHIELRRHLEGDLLPRQQSPLLWWKQNCGLFPQLQEQAMKFLSCPATSVSSERLFSKAGELVSQRRANLKDTTINMVLFLNKNLKL